MKKYSCFFICLFLLFGCTQQEIKEKEPSYLNVFNYYKTTDYYNICNNYKDEVKKIAHHRYSNVYPGTLKDDMDIINKKETTNNWEFELSCTIKATYYVSSNTILNENYDYPLTVIYYDKKTKTFH